MKGIIDVRALFPERLKEARIGRDMTQEQLGEAAGVYTSTIAHFEAGSRLPSLSNLQRISQALVISADYLIGNSDRRGMADNDIIHNLSYANSEEYALIRHMTEYIRSKR